MLFKVLSVAALSAITSFAYIGSAQALTFKMTTGVNGPNGETNQGAYSQFAQDKGVVTVDFNDGKLPTTGFAKYSFSQNNNYSSVRADMWAPTGANGEKNESNYLAVFAGNDLTIQLEKTLNYFGIDWGAAHEANTFTFFKGDKLVKAFTTADIEAAGGFALYSALHPGGPAGQPGQGNGYVHFYSESNEDNFDRIVIQQLGGGGFESDNHSFRVGTGKFDPQAVPEPGVAFGLLGLGGLLLRKRKAAKSA
jgi:hypothetical protein